MTTQYTTILKLALPVQGELSGTWGDVVNDNITQMVEQAVAGKAVVNTWTGNSHTLTTADGTTSESRCAILELTDSGTALTGAGTVVCPTNTKLYIVDNNTAEIITVQTAAGTGVAVPVGKTMLVYCDGTNVVEGITHANSLSLGTSTVTADKILDEDNMASDSATAIATQQSIKAYVDSQVGTVDTLSEILANGNTTGANDIDVDSAQKVQFRDTAIYINSSADGQLDLVADTEIQIAATTIDVNGTLAFDSLKGTGATTVTNILDEDNMASDSATAIATQQSIKAYVDSQVGSFDTLAEVLAQGNTTGGTDLAVSAGDDITFTDTSKAIFGAGSDLQIYHDGSNSYISDQGTGDLRIWADSPNIATASGNKIFFGNSGYAELYAAGGAIRLATTNTGIQVTGDIANASGDLTLDVAGDIILDADGADIKLKDGGTEFARFSNTGTAFQIYSPTSDKDITFVGNDGGSTVTALTLDISAAGAATFNAGATFGSDIDVTGTVTADGLTVTGTLGNWSIDSQGVIQTFTRNSTNYIRASDASGALRFDTGGSIGRLNIASNGDVSLYEDTGTTPKFFWDASAESLQLGGILPQTSAIFNLRRNGTNIEFGHGNRTSGYYGTLGAQYTNGQPFIGFSCDADDSGNTFTTRGFKGNVLIGTAAGDLTFNQLTNANASGQSLTERMRIDASGNVGIGCTPDWGIQTGNFRGSASAPVFSGTSGDGFAFDYYNGPNPYPRHGSIAVIGAGTATADMSFWTDSGSAVVERMRIDASGNVGIGSSGALTSTYLSKAFVYTAGGANFALGGSSDTNDAVLSRFTSFNISNSNSGNEGSANFYGVTSIESIVVTTDSNAGDDSGGSLLFKTKPEAGALAERMRIDSSGNLLVGKSATTLSVAGTYISAAGSVGVTRASDDCLTLNRTGSDGAIASFYKDGTTVGSIGAISSDLEIHSSVSDHVGIRFANGGLFPTDNTGTVTNGAADIGNGSYRFKDLFLSGGVVFGDAGGSGTPASNTLDSYEEGTWTPALANIGTGTYTHQVGRYTKIGNLVTASVHIDINVLGTASGSVDITNLPFTASAVSNNYGSASSIHAQNFTTAAEGLNVLINPNTAVANVFSGSGATSAAVNLTHAVMGTGNLLCTLVYFTA
jgi:hypothetical protein